MHVTFSPNMNLCNTWVHRETQAHKDFVVSRDLLVTVERMVTLDHLVQQVLVEEM